MDQNKPSGKIRSFVTVVSLVVFLLVKHFYGLIQPSLAAQASVGQIKNSVVEYNLYRMFITGDPIGMAMNVLLIGVIVAIWWGYVSYHLKNGK